VGEPEHERRKREQLAPLEKKKRVGESDSRSHQSPTKSPQEVREAPAVGPRGWPYILGRGKLKIFRGVAEKGETRRGPRQIQRKGEKKLLRKKEGKRPRETYLAPRRRGGDTLPYQEEGDVDRTEEMLSKPLKRRTR